MKSKLFKQHQKEKDKEAKVGGVNSNQRDEDSSELEARDTSVASAKSSKLMVVVASAILITLVIYFLFFKTDSTSPTEKLEEVSDTPITSPVTPTAGGPAAPDRIEDLLGETATTQSQDILQKPALPEIPKLPEVPQNVSFNETLLPNFLDVPKEETVQQPATDPLTGQAGGIGQAPQEPPKPLDPRRSPIIVESTGAGSAITSINEDRYAGGIIPLNPDAIDSLKETQSSVVATIVKDRTTKINQGKIMTAVLETAINTEFPGSVRGIISRDVYAESGTNVLIPKGSRIYGSYSTQIVRGQGRVEITWSRLIRPDGVDLQVAFLAADQFGRSGIEGDIDNKYGSIFANSLLTSAVAVGGALLADQLSGNEGSTTTTNPSTGTTTSTSTATSQVAVDVSRTLVDTVSRVVNDTLDLRPVIRIPQGTRITIVVNSDMTIPKMRDSK